MVHKQPNTVGQERTSGVRAATRRALAVLPPSHHRRPADTRGCARRHLEHPQDGGDQRGRPLRRHLADRGVRRS